jgi:hypothetical protein
MGMMPSVVRMKLSGFASTMTGTIPAEIGCGDGAETLVHEHFVDDFIGGDSHSLIPELGDDDGRLSSGLADDHAGLLRDCDPFECEIAPEDGDVKRHAAQVFLWQCVAAIKPTVRYAGNLSIDPCPSPFHGT